MLDTSDPKISSRITPIKRQVTAEQLAKKLPTPSPSWIEPSARLYEYHSAFGLARLNPIYEFLSKEPDSVLLVDSKDLKKCRYELKSRYSEPSSIWASERTAYEEKKLCGSRGIAWEDAKKEWEELEELRAKCEADSASDSASNEASTNPSESTSINPSELSSTNPIRTADDGRVQVDDDVVRLAITPRFHTTSNVQSPDNWVESKILPYGSKTSASYIFIDREIIPVFIVFNGVIPRDISKSYLASHFSEFIKSYTVLDLNGLPNSMRIDSETLVDILYDATLFERSIIDKNQTIVLWDTEQQVVNSLASTYLHARIILISTYRRMLVNITKRFHSYSKRLKTLFTETIDSFKLKSIYLKKIDITGMGTSEIFSLCNRRARGRRWLLYQLPSKSHIKFLRMFLLKQGVDEGEIDKYIWKTMRELACYYLLKFWRPMGKSYQDDMVFFVTNNDIPEWKAEKILYSSSLVGIAKIKKSRQIYPSNESANYKRLASKMFSASLGKTTSLISSYIYYSIARQIYFFSIVGFKKFLAGMTHKDPLDNHSWLSHETVLKYFKDWLDNFEDSWGVFQEGLPIVMLKKDGKLKFRTAFIDFMCEEFHLERASKNLAASDINTISSLSDSNELEEV